ncbi:MAG: ATP-binding protein [bacterium]
MFNLNPFSIPPLISSIMFLLLGVFVLWNNRKAYLNIIFFFVCIFTVWWQVSWFFLFNTQDYFLAQFLVRFGYVGIILIPVIFFHFSLEFLKVKNKIDKIILSISYFLSFVFIVSLFFTDYFVEGFYKYYWGYYPDVSFFHLIYLLLLILLLFRILFILISNLYRNKELPKFKHQQIKYFLWGMVFYAIASIDFLINYGFEIYPFGFLFLFIFLAIISYSIVVHRLMDIKLVLRQSSVYSASIIVVVFLVIPIDYLIAKNFSKTDFATDLIILILAIFIFPFVRNFFYKIANRYFFTSLYDPNKVISEISDRLRSTLELKEIYRILDETFLGTFHPKSFGILKYKPEKESYYIEYNNGFNTGRKKKFPGNQELHDNFISQGKPILTEVVKENNYNKKTKPIIDLLDSLDVEVLVPLNAQDQTVGLLVLSSKESGDIYNEEDLGVLKIAGAQAATAIENALFYEEMKKFNVKLKKEVKKATRNLEKANKDLKRVNQEKNEFISIISHQLRAPLTATKGYVSMLMDGSFGKIKPQAKEALERVFKSNERLIGMVNELLNVSRIESGRMEFNFEEVDLQDIVKDVVEEMEEKAQEKELKLEYKHKDDLPKIKGDPNKLNEIIMNLIENAIKYTSQGKVVVNITKTNGNLKFKVKDNGLGIKQDDLDNLFQKFYRGTGKASKMKGTGLGLYVAKKVVNAHGGKIWAESKGEGHGSVFYFTIPCIKKK